MDFSRSAKKVPCCVKVGCEKTGVELLDRIKQKVIESKRYHRCMPEEKIALLQKADNSGNERQEPPLDQITLVREGQITAVRNTKTGPSRYRVA